MDEALTPRFGIGVVVALVFAFSGSMLTLWSRSQPLVAVGRVMDETRLVRVRIQLPDRAQTEQRRTAARQSTPRVFNAVESELEGIRASLEGLPRALSGVGSVAEVEPGLREQFGLDEAKLKAVRAEASNGEVNPAWVSKVSVLMEALKRRPMLDGETFQRAQSEGTHSMVRLVFAKGEPLLVRRSELINADARDAEAEKGLATAMAVEARDAGFEGPLREVVVRRLAWKPRATFTFDAATTARDQNAAAEQVPVVMRVSPPGQVIFQRGERLKSEQYDLYQAEAKEFASSVEAWRQWARHGAVIVAVSSITAGLAGYTVLFCPRVRRKGSRIIGVAGILLGTFAGACVGTASFPGAGVLTSTMPTVLVAILIAIGYDRRAALAYGLLHGLLVCVALRSTMGTMVTMTAGIACVVSMSGGLRDRNAFVRLSVVTAVGMSASVVAMGLIERPILSEGYADPSTDAGLVVMREILVDAGLAGIGVLVVGSATLFLLPWLERAFDVATGMTLIELRDPKQPLLRELQQRAPGTYNHSLNVAAIAENAADAIGGDGLLTYVGALYHDVGKMNKPEYFVENQAGGPNKHDKLSPAMSLLVVVGHVKEGMELAREYDLPKAIRHFIESHHGTTLVEYFYHRARQQAERAGESGGEEQVPDEFEYRYPGPRPRTKEAAVLMVADASESAARALGEPTPAKIDQLVRTIANKRLVDGQFDDCELTLKELSAIVESVTRSLTGIYHGRIAYPSSEPVTGDVGPAEDTGSGAAEKRA